MRVLAAAALAFVITCVAYAAGQPSTQASHPYSPSMVWDDLKPGHAQYDGTLGFATCPESYPTTWHLGIEQQWDSILGDWDFYEVEGCATDVLLDWEGALGSCEAAPVSDPNATACVVLSPGASHGGHQDIPAAKVLFDVNHPNGHTFASFGPNYEQAISAHEWGHILGLDDDAGTPCTAGTLMGEEIDFTRKATDNPCLMGPTVADRVGVGCSAYLRYCPVVAGTLFMSEGGGPVWVVDGGVKRWVSSAQLFDACGYHWDEVIALPSSTVNMIPNGATLYTGPPCPYMLAHLAPNIYVIRQTWKHLIQSTEAFNACAYNLGYVVTVPSLAGYTTLNAAMPPCPYVRYPRYCSAVMEGQLIQGLNSVNVYLIASGTKRYISSPAVFEACGFKWNDIVRVPDTTVSMMATGANVGAPPCNHTLVKGSGVDIYVMEYGQKRWITGSSVFEACGYSGGEIVGVSDDALNAISTGPPLNAPPCPFTRPQ